MSAVNVTRQVVAAVQVDGTTPLVLEVGVPGPVGPQGQTGPAGPQGPQGVPGLTWRGFWNGTTAYVPNDAVTYAGSSWRNILADTGHAPPSLPSTANTYWMLLAAKGDAIVPHMEQFSGNGTAGPYPLSFVPMNDSLIVSVNGLTQTPGVDYTVSSNSLFFGDAAYAEDHILVNYLS